jgi:hypothetical protein
MGWIKNLKKAGACESCDCPPAVCNPCCPVPELLCETRSASKTKFAACGVLHSGTYYLVMVETMEYGWSRTTTYTQDPVTGACTSVVVCAGSWTYAVELHCEGDDTEMPGVSYYCHFEETFQFTKNPDCTGSGAVISGSYYRTITEAGITEVLDDCTFNAGSGQWEPYYPSNPCPGCPNLTETYTPPAGTPSTAYSSPWTPETTAALIARTEAALPSWPGTWSGTSCSALRNLSPDESSYSIREARFKFKLPTGATLPAGKKLVIDYQTTFTPEAGGSPTVTDASIEITGTDTESSIITVSVPSDGTTTLAMTAHECVDA